MTIIYLSCVTYQQSCNKTGSSIVILEVHWYRFRLTSRILWVQPTKVTPKIGLDGYSFVSNYCHKMKYFGGYKSRTINCLFKILRLPLILENSVGLASCVNLKLLYCKLSVNLFLCCLWKCVCNKLTLWVMIDLISA